MRSSITNLWAGTSLLALLVLSAGYARATILLFDQERFDLAGFAPHYPIAGVSVLEGTTSLFPANSVLVEGNASGPLHTNFEFATPLSAQQLLVQIDLSNLASSIQDNVAIDNIRFGQTPPSVIPEPGRPTGRQTSQGHSNGGPEIWAIVSGCYLS